MLSNETKRAQSSFLRGISLFTLSFQSNVFFIGAVRMCKTRHPIFFPSTPKLRCIWLFFSFLSHFLFSFSLSLPLSLSSFQVAFSEWKTTPSEKNTQTQLRSAVDYLSIHPSKDNYGDFDWEISINLGRRSVLDWIWLITGILAHHLFCLCRFKSIGAARPPATSSMRRRNNDWH